MICKACEIKMVCMDSRWVLKYRGTRRRWGCPRCEARVTTREISEEVFETLMSYKNVFEKIQNILTPPHEQN